MQTVYHLRALGCTPVCAPVVAKVLRRLTAIPGAPLFACGCTLVCAHPSSNDVPPA